MHALIVGRRTDDNLGLGRKLKEIGIFRSVVIEEEHNALDRILSDGKIYTLFIDLLAETAEGLSFLRKINKYNCTLKCVYNIGESREALCSSIASFVSLLDFSFSGDISVHSPLKQIKDKIINGAVGKTVYNQSTKEIYFTLEELRAALLNGDFVYHYQPQYNINTGSLIGLEALARWNNHKSGVLSAALFMDDIINNDLLDDFFESIFAHGLAFQKSLMELGKLIQVSYNIDIRQLLNENFATTVIQKINAYTLDYSCVTLELTETSDVIESPLVMENIIRLANAGIKLSIDDFGVSHSSLSRLLSFPFSEIKLDAKFIRSIHDNPNSKLAINSVLSLANDMHLSLVVEGVEDISHVNLMKDIGCSLAQGFYYSKPKGSSDILNVLCQSE
ncbi:EAL domain-containing protein [Vibrio furnissii]|uniref:EAL domain-containing protein n=1 Tax=Vibrio furnissii TaxID=29494 RepID=UPI00056F14D8|nr:EAL domain-containing protein [Vibrio furnissii]QDC94692.1 EAL domain-containing protein [Vibrio furnissii]TRN24907.1 EAL domain-containing protein [Vibrio furnissii]UON50131.1 EAL domain-containing protein [Vibrio furnissii]WJG23447.1 EAL domain-containing protein [Vibrio furnissii]SUQ32365.1 response regulator receiver modulated diguanylate phosphodiesterase [Vibrio furnissii]